MKLRIFTEPQEGASYEQQLRVAQAAESLGFDAFFRSDHYLAMSGGLPGPTDSWVTSALWPGRPPVFGWAPWSHRSPSGHLACWRSRSRRLIR